MSAQIIGHSVNETHTTAQLALGTEFETGGTSYRYVKAGSAIAAGDALKTDTANADEPNALIPTAALNDVVAAIAHVAIASASFGWATVRGKVKDAKVAAATAAGAQLGASGTAGTLSTITIAAAYAQAEVQRVLAASVGVGVQAVDAEAAGVAEVFIHG